MAMSFGSSVLSQASNIFQSILLNKFIITPRILSQAQFTRGRRRTCRTPPWQVQRRIDPFWHQKELTNENREFLKEAVVDHYEKLKTSPLKDGPSERNQWTPKTVRTGVLAIKIGVIPQWTKTGEKFHTTLLQVIDNHVIRYTPPEVYGKSEQYRHNKWAPGYGCVVVGALSADPFLFTKAYCGLFAEAGVPPKRKLTRFIVTPDAAVQPGTPLFATHFQAGDYVDCQAKTIGHGFQGVVKRWGFKGGPASHGTTKWHRRPGNIGGGRGKAKVFKGKKMPGHMGMEWRIAAGLKIWRINTKYNILYVHGQAVPGPTHCYVRIYDSSVPARLEKRIEKPPVMPTYFPGDLPEPVPEELFDAELFQFTEPSIVFAETEKSKAPGKSKTKSK